MSVVHFSPQELAQVVSLAVGNIASSDGKRNVDRGCEQMAEYSRQNAAAYVATYGGDAPAWDAADIKGYVRMATRMDQYTAALRTIDLLRYNLVANNGRDFATVSTLSTILSMSQAIARKTRARCYDERAAA